MSASIRVILTYLLFLLCYADEIIRFFDSSPFDALNKWIGTTRINGRQNNTVDIFVHRIADKWKQKIDETCAWGSQTGAQVQWDGSTEYVYYNVVSCDDNHVHARRRNLVTNKTDNYFYPIYHIRRDGLYFASPDLRKIIFSQKGYGVDHFQKCCPNQVNDTLEIGFPRNNGLYITHADLYNGFMLVSLHDLLVYVAGIPDTTDVSAVGFHVKWSHDGLFLMFIVRTLHHQSMSTYPLRRQHIFILDFYGLKRVQADYPQDSLAREQALRRVCHYITSWHSLKAQSVYACDGNHPSFIDGTHNILLNWKCDQSVHYAVYVFDVEALIRDKANVRDEQRAGHGNHLRLYEHNRLKYMTQLYPVGTGHPTMFVLPAELRRKWDAFPWTSSSNLSASSRWHGYVILTDMYAKEMALVNQLSPLFPVTQDNKAEDPESVVVFLPLRLIDIAHQQEVWLTQIPLVRKRGGERNGWGWVSRRHHYEEENHWRADAHPCLSWDRSLVAFNYATPTDTAHVRAVHYQPLKEFFQRISPLETKTID